MDLEHEHLWVSTIIESLGETTNLWQVVVNQVEKALEATCQIG